MEIDMLLQSKFSTKYNERQICLINYLKNQMKGEHLVYDENMRGFAKSLNLFEGPSMMLVNSEGIVIAKEPSQRLSDQVNVDKVLQIFFKEK